MAITINPTLQPVTAPAPSAPVSGIVLQAGQVISAEVLQVLGNGEVQIAIGNETIQAATQVPLQAGQTLQLQVSQTPGGIGLAIVDQPSTAANPASTGGSATSDPVITLSPSLAAAVALTADAMPPSTALTQLETLAVSTAAQTAATQQSSLAPLFADLNAATYLPNLPSQLQQAVAQVLAQRTNLDQNLTAGGLKQAFQSSGLFLEASLASGAAPASNGVPDLKAALIVLRQALTSALSDVTENAGVAPVLASQADASQAVVTGGTSATMTSGAAAILTNDAIPASVSVSAAEQGTATVAAVAGESTAQVEALPAAVAAELAPQAIAGAPSIAPQASPLTATATPSAQSAAPVALAQILGLTPGNQNLNAVPAAAARAAASSAAFNLLQEVVQASPLAITDPSQFVAENGQALALLPVVAGVRTTDDAEFARTNLPPPPINGALPSAQPVAPATLNAHTPFEVVLRHLLADTDGALARQTLLQIASLPGQVTDSAAMRIDPSIARWHFEIPFATPQGTALAQFEISRDGGGREISAAKATWRARFSLDVEPAGPVHALVSLSGDRTSVKMWAERPATASQLRSGVSQLTQALSRAELMPGDIVIRDGAPQQPAPASAGHFLDRAS